jgi:hypothetical protein
MDVRIFFSTRGTAVLLIQLYQTGTEMAAVRDILLTLRDAYWLAKSLEFYLVGSRESFPVLMDSMTFFIVPTVTQSSVS